MTWRNFGQRSQSRERLSKLLREAGELLSVDDAARVLALTNTDAAKVLARWCEQGWISRVKRGLYVAVPIEASSTTQALEDAWVLVPELFDPAYVGGWSAAEHWDLTEQIFRDICVFSARSVASRRQLVHNTPFVLTHVPSEHHFGTKPVWRKEKRILVSDPTKTIVDMLSIPWAGGGVQHVVDCVREYLGSGHRNDDLVIEYAERLRNGAVFKRLGFIASRLLGEAHPLAVACQARLTKGNAQLDPELRGDRLITRWRLFIPRSLTIEGSRK